MMISEEGVLKRGSIKRKYRNIEKYFVSVNSFFTSPVIFLCVLQPFFSCQFKV